MQLFAKSEDPDIPGHVILEQFQAQVSHHSSISNINRNQLFSLVLLVFCCGILQRANQASLLFHLINFFLSKRSWSLDKHMGLILDALFVRI